MSELARAEALLREGTEILGNGGVVVLRARDCRALLLELERLRRVEGEVSATVNELLARSEERDQRIVALERRHNLLLDLTNRDVEGQYEQRLREEGLDP